MGIIMEAVRMESSDVSIRGLKYLQGLIKSLHLRDFFCMFADCAKIAVFLLNDFHKVICNVFVERTNPFSVVGKPCQMIKEIQAAAVKTAAAVASTS